MKRFVMAIPLFLFAACGADLGAGPDGADEALTQYHLNIAIVVPDDGGERVISNPQIMTLRGEPATLRTTMSAPADRLVEPGPADEVVEIEQLLEIVPETAGENVELRCSLRISYPGDTTEAQFHLLVRPGQTVAVDVARPFPWTIEIAADIAGPNMDQERLGQGLAPERGQVSGRVVLQ